VCVCLCGGEDDLDASAPLVVVIMYIDLCVVCMLEKAEHKGKHASNFLVLILIPYKIPLTSIATLLCPCQRCNIFFLVCSIISNFLRPGKRYRAGHHGHGRAALGT